MRKKHLSILTFFVLVVIITFSFLTNRHPLDGVSESINSQHKMAITGIPTDQIKSPFLPPDSKVSDQKAAAPNDNQEILLNTGNFENFVSKCFAGEPCQFGEDPLKIYQEFNDAGNRTAMDNLISFLRSRMSNLAFRDRYKNLLKQMIDDFYPPEEKQFQEAAYYNYLEDYQKSLDLYLDLQKKSQTDPTLRPAPLLNIANTLYELRRFKEALPYYEAALRESLENPHKPVPNNESFIEDRIAEIKSKLNASRL